MNIVDNFLYHYIHIYLIPLNTCIFKLSEIATYLNTMYVCTSVCVPISLLIFKLLKLLLKHMLYIVDLVIISNTCITQFHALSLGPQFTAGHCVVLLNIHVHIHMNFESLCLTIINIIEYLYVLTYISC